MKLLFIKLTAILFWLFTSAFSYAADTTTDAALETKEVQSADYIVAILPFRVDVDDDDIKAKGHEIAVLLNTSLLQNESIMLVERAQIDAILSEQELGLSGLVDGESAAKIGHLLGAKVLVTGQVMVDQKDLVFAAKIIGVETGVVMGVTESMSMKGSIETLSNSMAKRMGNLFETKGHSLIAKPVESEDLLEKLLPYVDGRDLPSVTIDLLEKRFNKGVEQSVVETELAYYLQQLGFDVIDAVHSNKKSDVLITGEALTDYGVRNGNLISTKTNVNIKAIARSTGKTLLITRTNSVGVEITIESSAQKSLVKSAEQLIEALVKALIKA